jgi:RimJ/RimL family protein N-acetyltransferase
MYIHKNGITLRKLEKKDLSLLKDLKNESWFGTHNITLLNDLDQERWFESLDSRTHLILIAEVQIENSNNAVAKNSKHTTPIGLYKIQNIDWVNRRYDSAHDVFKPHRGNGFSKPVLEAGVDFGFEVLNMNRIDTEVLENNIASFKSAIWVGFIEEGRKRKCIHKCSEYLDSVFLGILKDEWKSLQRVIDYNGICNISYQPKNTK